MLEVQLKIQHCRLEHVARVVKQHCQREQWRAPAPYNGQCCKRHVKQQ